VTPAKNHVAATTEAKKSWWREPATIIPIAVSVIAAVFTGATYFDQHAANSAAAISSATADARAVSFRWTDTAQGLQVDIYNLGSAPIYDVFLAVDFGSRPDYFPLGTIAPCSDGQMKMVRSIDPSWDRNNGGPVINTTVVQFRDANGVTWQLNEHGVLQEAASYLNTHRFASVESSPLLSIVPGVCS